MKKAARTHPPFHFLKKSGIFQNIYKCSFHITPIKRDLHEGFYILSIFEVKKMDFERAIKRPFSDIQKFVIGALLNILPIINFLSLGYALKAAKLSLKKNAALPEWDGWGDLFAKGFLAIVIGLIYFIPAFTIFLIFGGSAMFSMMAGGFSSMAVFAAMGTSLLAALILSVVIGYVLPLALLSFVETERFGAAFEFEKIFRKAFKGDYFAAWVVSLFISVILTFVAAIIPFLRVILLPAASFASMMIMFTLIGEIYTEL